MARRLATFRRVSLAGIADGWTDDCYVDLSLITYEEMKALSQLDAEAIKKSGGDGYPEMVELIRPHVLGGKVMALNDVNEPVLDSIQDGDIDSLPPSKIAELFQAVSGVAPDPKV